MADTLAGAIVELQAQLPRIGKDETADTGSYSYRYAGLDAITAAAMPLLASLGLYYTCKPAMDGEQFGLVCTLGHAPSGETDVAWWPLPKANAQGIGGAMTYGRRYTFCAMTGIAPAEDDDDAAQEAAEAAERQRQRTDAIQRERAASPPPHTRPAERSKGPMEDDPWATAPEQASEDVPGAVGNDNRLRARLHAAYGRAKISARDDRMAYAMSKLNLPELKSSNDLSVRQAHELIAYLNAEVQD